MARLQVDARTFGHATVTRDAHEGAAAESLVALIPTLLATARFLVKDESEARDLVQTTLEIGFHRLSQLRDPGKLRPWLLAIQAHEAARVRRRLGRLVSLESHVQEIGVGPSPDDRTFTLRQALERLPIRIRTAVVLHHMAGLSIAETAHAMGVAENTVKSELATGLRRLREGLDDSGE